MTKIGSILENVVWIIIPKQTNTKAVAPLTKSFP